MKHGVETTYRSDFGGKHCQSGGEGGCYREKFRNFARQKHRLMPPSCGGGGIISEFL